MVTTEERWRPKFGEAVTNTVASADNPRRTGQFVRVVRRQGRVINPGTWWELTDGKGSFWLTPPAICIPADGEVPPPTRPDPSVSERTRRTP